MGDTLRLTGAGSAMSLRSSAPALLHALRTRYPGDRAPCLNQARATYPGGVSELDAALQVLHPPDKDLEVGGITVFVEGAGEAPAPGRPTPYTTAPGLPPRKPSCARRSPGNPPGAPPSRRLRTRPAAGPAQTCPPPSPGPGVPTTGSRSSGKSARAPPCSSSPSRPAGTLEPVLGITPTHLYGTAPVPRPPLPAPGARDGVHTFLRTQEVTAVTGVHLVWLPPAPPDDPRRPRALSPAPDWELWRDAWAAWHPRLPSQCRLKATGPRPHGADATADPPSPPPLPPAEHCTALPTARH